MRPEIQQNTHYNFSNFFYMEWDCCKNNEQYTFTQFTVMLMHSFGNCNHHCHSLNNTTLQISAALCMLLNCIHTFLLLSTCQQLCNIGTVKWVWSVVLWEEEKKKGGKGLFLVTVWAHKAECIKLLGSGFVHFCLVFCDSDVTAEQLLPHLPSTPSQPAFSHPFLKWMTWALCRPVSRKYPSSWSWAAGPGFGLRFWIPADRAYSKTHSSKKAELVNAWNGDCLPVGCHERYCFSQTALTT